MLFAAAVAAGGGSTANARQWTAIDCHCYRKAMELFLVVLAVCCAGTPSCLVANDMDLADLEGNRMANEVMSQRSSTHRP